MNYERIADALINAEREWFKNYQIELKDCSVNINGRIIFRYDIQEQWRDNPEIISLTDRECYLWDCEVFSGEETRQMTDQEMTEIESYVWI